MTTLTDGIYEFGKIRNIKQTAAMFKDIYGQEKARNILIKHLTVVHFNTVFVQFIAIFIVRVIMFFLP